MNIFEEVKMEESINGLMSFVLSYLEDLSVKCPKNEKLFNLKDDIDCAVKNYNDWEVEEDVRTDSQEEAP